MSSLLRNFWKDLKPQLDWWSLLHFFVPVGIVYVLINIDVNLSLSIFVGIMSSYLWEFFDHCYKERILPFQWDFLDIRGASWVDYWLGVLGIFLIYSQYDLYNIITGYVLFALICICMYEKENWRS